MVDTNKTGNTDMIRRMSFEMSFEKQKKNGLSELIYITKKKKMSEEQTCVELVVFCEHKGIYDLDDERVIHPELYRLFLASSNLQSQEDVKTPRFWEKLRFTIQGDYDTFMQWLPTSSQTENLKFYWFNSYDINSPMTDTLDQYTLIPHDEVKDMLALIGQHYEEAKPRPVPLPLMVNIENDNDNLDMDYRCCIMMGQVLQSINPGFWINQYEELGCSLVPCGSLGMNARYWVLLVTDSLLHRTLDWKEMKFTKRELKRGKVSWARFGCKEWNNEVSPKINAQLQKDGLGPMRPLVNELIYVKGSQIAECGHVREAVNIRHVILPIV
jgi:hypothetical protein